MAKKKTTKREAAATPIERLKVEYDALVPMLERFRSGLVEQIEKVTDDNSLSLAFPIESRVKSWSSISEKIERKALRLKTIQDIPDLVGVRVAFLFLRDLRTACSAVGETFSVEDEEDVVGRLGDSEFGYQSFHYGVTIPETWATVPTFSGCANIVAEIQLRTIAQHTWAAASHLLQYKQESGVPLSVRRSIHRVSALLETVDLEFERALIEREEYREKPTPERSGEEELNVDLLESTLDSLLPPENRGDEEPYDELLVDLEAAGIETLDKLRALIGKHLKPALKHDAEIVEGVHQGYGREPERIEKGVYLAHAGLIRHMLGRIGERS